MRRMLRAQALVVAGGVLAFLLVFGAFGGAGDPARWVGAGVIAAPAVMAYVHRWAAAWAAIFAAVAWTSLASTYAAALVVWAYAATAVLVAQRDRPAPVEAVPHRRVPTPAVPPRVARFTATTGAAMLGAAALGVGWVWLDHAFAPWLTPVLAGAGLGCALLARALHDQRAVHDLFALPQPVHAVRVVEQLGYLHVLLPAADGRTAREFSFDIAEDDDPEPGEEPHTAAAVLYGQVRPGGWCAVTVDGRLHVPAGPVGEVIEVPYDVVQALPREIEDDEEQLVDPDALRPADRGTDAFRTREHRIAPHRAWVATVTIGLGTALAAAQACQPTPLPLPGTVTLVALAAAAGCEFGWRTQLRPRLRWHAGGVAAVGFRGCDRQPWATDSAVIHDDRGSVVLTAGESVLTIPVPPPWPSTADQRTADQLVAALRDARARSLAISELPAPPTVEVPRRPLALYAAFLLSTVAAILIVR